MATFYFNSYNASGGGMDADWATVHVAATGDLTFTDQPLDGETVTIDSTIFEFDNDNSVTEGNISVEIGVDLDTTLNNLGAAITSNFTIVYTVNDPVLNLTAYTPGTMGNLYIITTTSTVITVNAMSGGIDGNWWTNSDCTVPATSLPTSSDDVIALDTIGYNSGDNAEVGSFIIGEWSFFYIHITITANSFTFNGNSWVAEGGVIIGNNILFTENSSADGIIIGDTTFDDASYVLWNTICAGNVTFNDSAYTYTDNSTSAALGVPVDEGGNIVYDYNSEATLTLNGYSFVEAGTYANGYAPDIYGGIFCDAVLNGPETFIADIHQFATITCADENVAAYQIKKQMEYCAYNSRMPISWPNSVVINVKRGINGSSILGIV